MFMIDRSDPMTCQLTPFLRYVFNNYYVLISNISLTVKTNRDCIKEILNKNFIIKYIHKATKIMNFLKLNIKIKYRY